MTHQLNFNNYGLLKYRGYFYIQELSIEVCIWRAVLFEALLVKNSTEINQALKGGANVVYYIKLEEHRMDRLEKQMEFLIEVDKLKKITRQNYLADGSRKENDAEHSWHLALMAFVLCEYHRGEESIDVLKVIKMVLLHDVVEIDAGDTYCYDDDAALGQWEREREAAERLFNILPSDQARDFRELWEEFEERRTPEAQFAAALDRLQPLTLNYKAGGESWKEHQIALSQVLERNNSIEESSPELWNFACQMIQEAVNRGYIRKDR